MTKTRDMISALLIIAMVTSIFTLPVLTNSEVDAASKKVKVKFNANGGKVGKKLKTVKKNMKVGKLPKATKKGYFLAGWYTKKSGGTKYTSSKKIKKNITLYAHWKKNGHAIFTKMPKTFILTMGGKWVSEIKVKPDGTFTGQYKTGTYYVDQPGYELERYECNFSGKFTSVKKISDYEYSMKLSKLKLKNKVGTSKMVDGIRVEYVERSGLENSKNYRIYVKGRKTSDLLEDAIMWFGSSGKWSNDPAPTKLPFYCIRNMDSGGLFFSGGM